MATESQLEHLDATKIVWKATKPNINGGNSGNRSND